MGKEGNLGVAPFSADLKPNQISLRRKWFRSLLLRDLVEGPGMLQLPLVSVQTP